MPNSWVVDDKHLLTLGSFGVVGAYEVGREEIVVTGDLRPDEEKQVIFHELIHHLEGHVPEHHRQGLAHFGNVPGAEKLSMKWMHEAMTEQLVMLLMEQPGIAYDDERLLLQAIFNSGGNELVAMAKRLYFGSYGQDPAEAKAEACEFIDWVTAILIANDIPSLAEVEEMVKPPSEKQAYESIAEAISPGITRESAEADWLSMHGIET